MAPASPTENPIPTLRALGLSESEVSAYLALVRDGALTVRELLKRTHLKRPTAYYALTQLVEKGLIARTGQRGAERYQAEDPKALSALVMLQQQELAALSDDIDRVVIPSLIAGKPVHDALPIISFYEGETAMKRVILETLECRSGHIDSIAPADNYFWQAGQAFSQRYIDARVARKITTRNLWEKPLRPEILTRSYKGLSQVRLLPAIMHGRYKTTIFVYDATVMYISSQRSGYVLVVQSREHFETMRAVFDGLWEKSTDITGRFAAAKKA